MSLVPPGRTRRIGRSRRHTGSDLPVRLMHWHAPRANRWEHLFVLAGEVDTQWLEPADIKTLRLCAGQSPWIPPGSRWRIAHLETNAAFALEVHADETTTAAAPQTIRARVLDGLVCRRADSTSQLASILDGITAGTLVRVQADFDFMPTLSAATPGATGALFWHPLEVCTDRCSVLIGRSVQPIALVDYMARDHVLIEATLAGALRGNPDDARWLASTLARHLAIEEQILFPAWLAAGGKPGLVQRLRNEHQQLRQNLPRLDDPTSRRRLLLLLDGHDEKEEQLIYPDIAECIAGADTAFMHRVLCRPLVFGAV